MLTLSTSAVCASCGYDALDSILDLGHQPPCNRFHEKDEPRPETHPLVLGCCRKCGLVQLIRPMTVDMVRPRHSWIRYNEPEDHLDRMVHEIIQQTELNSDARLLGLTYKDDTTLARFERSGFRNAYRLQANEDLGVESPLAGLETLQGSLTPARAVTIAARHGPADLLIVRHLLEHVHSPRSFLRALSLMLKPSGVIVFEIPDSAKFLRACDYSFVWEEHITYFTDRTVRTLMQMADLETLLIQSYEYPLEDSLAVLVKRGSRRNTEQHTIAADTTVAAGFGRCHRESRERVRSALVSLQRAGERVALFGAGHLAVKFLNIYGLEDLIHCVIDDHDKKLGLVVPGTKLRIRPSSVLLDEQIGLCLLSLNPASEQRVISAQHAFVDRGGRFRSIFELSPIAFLGSPR